MSNINMRGTIISKDRVVLNGVEYKPPKGKANYISVINNKVYIDGYELVNGEWKRTLNAIWHLLF